jgi:hypothetical protein
MVERMSGNRNFFLDPAELDAAQPSQRGRGKRKRG